MATPRLHCDIGTLAPVKRMPDGRLCAEAHFTRTGIFEYRNPDGTIRRELRLPEEVFRPESMASFRLVPLTDDHPPEMLTSSNAGKYARGSSGDTILRDDDHLRCMLGVFDADVASKMEHGKLELSSGYTCDLEEKPGVHPLWGQYDAIQRNIVGNHIALVERGRAGASARVRMDAAMMVADCDPDGAKQIVLGRKDEKSPGMRLAGKPGRGTVRATMPTAKKPGRRDADETVQDPEKPVEEPTDEPIDPEVPVEDGLGPSDDDDDDEEVDPDDEDPDDDEEDVFDGMYDSDGALTPAGESRVAVNSFALPGKKQLPIFDARATRSSMQRFSSASFDSPDEKHGAFNRIAARARQFKINTDAFRRQFGNKLDRKDQRMNDADKKLQRAKAREALIARAATAEGKLATAQGRIDSLTAELAAEKVRTEKARTDAAEKFDAAVAARVELISKARGVLGADKVTATDPDGKIMRAVIKHVDGKDVPDDKHPAYVEALFEGCVERGRKDAAAVDAAANALAAARGAAIDPAAKTVTDPKTAAIREDAGDEIAAQRAMRTRTAGLAGQPNPNGKTKSDLARR